MKFFRISLVLLVLLALCPVGPAQATTPPTVTFNVNTTNDTADANVGNGACADSSGNCSLRAAMQEGNKLGEGGYRLDVIINLQRDTTYTPGIKLDFTTNQVIIQSVPGSGAPATIDGISGRSLQVTGASGAPAVLQLNNVTIANSGGIGIANSDSTLWLDTVTLTGLNNAAGTPSEVNGGGAIYNYYGHLEMDNCTVSGNTTDSNGGAILNREGTFNIQNSTFSNNSARYGGAIYNLSGSNSVDLKHISGSIFEGNSASISGGALYINGYNIQNIDGTSSVYIKDSRIRNNQAANGGGISVACSWGHFKTHTGMNLANSEVSANIATSGNGGGIYVDNASVTVTDDINIENSTISGNEAFLSGGGIYIATDTTSSVTIYNTTITDNAADRLGLQDTNGGGYYNAAGSTLYLKNSILAGNRDLTTVGTVPTRVRDCSGTVDLYYSLLGIKYLSFCTLAPGSVGHLYGNNSTLDARLGPRTQGSTPAWYHPLLYGSPALDSADPAGCSGPGLSRILTVDQNHDPRPVGAACDMGARESLVFGIFLPAVVR